VISIQFDAREALGFIDHAHEQLPFALSVALNRTGNVVRQRQRQNAASLFTIRKPWVLGPAVGPRDAMTPAAGAKSEGAMLVDQRPSTKRDLVLTLAVSRPRRFMARHEQGGVRLSGTVPFAIPTLALRPTFEASVPLEWYPKSLRLFARRDVVGTMPALAKGKRGTYLVPGVGIFRRTSPTTTELIWILKDTITLPRRPWFSSGVDEVFRATIGPQFDAAWKHALATARPRTARTSAA